MLDKGSKEVGKVEGREGNGDEDKDGDGWLCGGVDGSGVYVSG